MSTQQVAATLITLLEDKANMMPHKACTLPNGTRVVEMFLPHGTKWKNFLVTINQVCGVADIVKVSLGPLEMCFHYNDDNPTTFSLVGCLTSGCMWYNF